jgi:hypothetical protein
MRAGQARESLDGPLLLARCDLVFPDVQMSIGGPALRPNVLREQPVEYIHRVMVATLGVIVRPEAFKGLLENYIALGHRGRTLRSSPVPNQQ